MWRPPGRLAFCVGTGHGWVRPGVEESVPTGERLHGRGEGVLRRVFPGMFQKRLEVSVSSHRVNSLLTNGEVHFREKTQRFSGKANRVSLGLFGCRGLTQVRCDSCPPPPTPGPLLGGAESSGSLDRAECLGDTGGGGRGAWRAGGEAAQERSRCLALGWKETLQAYDGESGAPGSLGSGSVNREEAGVWAGTGTLGGPLQTDGKAHKLGSGLTSATEAPLEKWGILLSQENEDKGRMRRNPGQVEGTVWVCGSSRPSREALPCGVGLVSWAVCVHRCRLVLAPRCSCWRPHCSGRRRLLAGAPGRRACLLQTGNSSASLRVPLPNLPVLLHPEILGHSHLQIH